MGTRDSIASSRRVESKLRSREALALRRQKLTYPEIAERLGVAVSTAYNRVRAELAEVASESRRDAEAIFKAELAELDQAIERARTLALDDLTDDKKEVLVALEVWRKMLADRRKLLGIDGKPGSANTDGAGQEVQVDFLVLRDLCRANGYDLVPLQPVVETTGESVAEQASDVDGEEGAGE